MPPPAVDSAGDNVVNGGNRTTNNKGNTAIVQYVPGVAVTSCDKKPLAAADDLVQEKHPDAATNSAPEESRNASSGTSYSCSKKVPKWVAQSLGLVSEAVCVWAIPNDGASNATRRTEMPYTRYLEYLYTEGRDVEGDSSRPSNVMLSKLKVDEEDMEIFYRGFRRNPFEIIQQQKHECPKPVYWFGFGECVVQVEYQGKVHKVYAVHESAGDTVGLGIHAHDPRVLYLYACSNAILEELTRTMIQATQPPKSMHRPKSKYKLNTLEVEDEEGIWQSHGTKNARLLESIILPDGMLESIVEDFDEFISEGTKAWFNDHGIPYRRSYLFFGPPGAGKTSCIRALAGNFDLPACFVSLGNIQIGNKQLHDALRRIPTPSILVLEDIDALFNENRRAEHTTALTFSGLLNALDGLVAAEGIVSIMTTNHVDRLDPALIRAGRVDRRFEFSAPDHAQVAKLFKSYYADADGELATEFANAVFQRDEKEARSIAILQGHFIFTRKKNPRECIDMLPTFFAEFFPMASQRNQTYFI